MNESYKISHMQYVGSCVSGGKYTYTDDLLHLQSSIPSVVRLPPECSIITTPLRVEVWEKYLQLFPDREYVQYLLDGIRQGFRIGCNNSSKLCSSSRNMRGAEEHPLVVQQYLQEEQKLGRIIPVHPSVKHVVHLSRFGVIPKKHQPGKWRLIVDLSSPTGASVNDFIDPSLCSLKYASVDDAAEFVFRSGRETQMAKLDIKSAYRNVPIHPHDRFLLGMQWQGEMLIDTCLPFGLRSAPKIFNALADAFEWIITDQGASRVEFVLHYLDDFLFIGSPHGNTCQESLSLALRLCQELGLPVMQEKVVGPSTVLDFLGIVIHSTKMELRLPHDKLSRLKHLIQAWLGKKSCTKRQLLSLIGYLQHASTVVKSGRTFLRRMIEASKRSGHLDAPMRLNAEFRCDVIWWSLFLEKWNGISIISSLCKLPVDQIITSDASGSWGCGAFSGNKWFNMSWVTCRAMEKSHISVKELLPIVISLAVWADSMQGKHIRCRCDNAAVVAMINKKSSKHLPAMHLLRCLFFICARSGITVSAEHLPGWRNKAADALSRNNPKLFFEEVAVTGMSLQPTPMKPALLAVLVDRNPNWLSADWSRSFVAII